MLWEKIMENCPFMKGIIEGKINEEVGKVEAEKNKEIADLKTTIEGLTATILMGGN